MFKKKKLNERGSITYFIGFVFLALVLLTLFAVVVPLLISINTSFYEAGERILMDTNDTVSNLEEGEIKNQLQASLTTSRNSLPEQINILQVFFQYGWLILILAILMVLFLTTRRNVESGQGLR